ncbi:hypothetical protein [Streptomyces boninensis]|uniref:hypothetical protein n=1 Tax=Streptomyces boninensis TaxID=2039455 RepID=UPI003B20B91A
MTGGWERKALRLMEFVAYPALAGAAFCVLALGVVTWLPALAAAAYVLQSWRTDGVGRCFTGVFAAFPRLWRELWRESVMATAALALLAANTAFLWGRPASVGYLLLPVQLMLIAALALYCLALAVVTTTEPPARRRRAALVFAYGTPRRGLLLLAVLVIAPLAALPIPLGPLLLGPTLPLMLGLSLHAPAAGAGKRPLTREVSTA